MQKIKKLFMFAFIILIGLGVMESMNLQRASNVKEVTYYELKEVIKQNKTEKFTLVEQESGNVALRVGNTVYNTTVNPNDNNIKELLNQHNIQYVYQKEVSFFQTFMSFGIPLLIIILILGFIFNKNQNGAGKANEMIKKGVGNAEIPTTKLSDVGGLSEETTTEIKQIIDIFKHKEEAKQLGIRPAKGALLYGPPGTGKTLLAKAIAHELGATFYATSGSSFVEMFVGVGASRVRELFENARKTKPSLIFIDEIDSVAKKRGLQSSNEERESTLNELLKQLDGVESNEDVFLIAATNRIDILDPAILRPGRFDYKILIGQPDLEGRKEIIDIHSKNKNLSDEVKEQLQLIAESTAGYSGADIEGVFNNAAKNALTKKRTKITMEDINYALDLSILGNANRKLNEEKTRRRVAYHEAGHALVGLVTKPKSVRKATIIPRGEALGFVAPLPKEMELSTPSELIDRLSMILAGGVAEMKKFGEHSIGVSGDVQQAKNIIENMVDLGMNDDDFILTFDKKDKEKQMQKIYHKALENCKTIIDKYEKEWEKLTEKLLEKETLTGDEIERIIHNIPEPEPALAEEANGITAYDEKKKEKPYKGDLEPGTI